MCWFTAAVRSTVACSACQRPMRRSHRTTRGSCPHGRGQRRSVSQCAETGQIFRLAQDVIPATLAPTGFRAPKNFLRSEPTTRVSPFTTAGRPHGVIDHPRPVEGGIHGKTVADQFAEILVAAGVKRIYGIAGDTLTGLTDTIRRQGKIEWLHIRHEEVAAFAAGAEAHLTGELAVCAGSCGLGNLHLINGLVDRHRSRVPVLAIAAHIPSAEIGAGYFQKTHPQKLFEECSHYCELVSGADQMPRVLEVAIREAVGKQGVSTVVIPGDVFLQPASDAPPPSSLVCCPPSR